MAWPGQGVAWARRSELSTDPEYGRQAVGHDAYRYARRAAPARVARCACLVGRSASIELTGRAPALGVRALSEQRTLARAREDERTRTAVPLSGLEVETRAARAHPMGRGDGAADATRAADHRRSRRFGIGATDRRSAAHGAPAHWSDIAAAGIAGQPASAEASPPSPLASLGSAAPSRRARTPVGVCRCVWCRGRRRRMNVGRERRARGDRREPRTRSAGSPRSRPDGQIAVAGPRSPRRERSIRPGRPSACRCAGTNEHRLMSLQADPTIERLSDLTSCASRNRELQVQCRFRWKRLQTTTAAPGDRSAHEAGG